MSVVMGGGAGTIGAGAMVDVYLAQKDAERVHILLVNVGWMRQQWDCSKTAPVPGSWLSSYIAGRPGLQTFPCCQELPPDAALPWSQVPLERRVAVSHKWQHKDHPSPSGSQFSELLSRAPPAIEELEHVHAEALLDDDYVFYDFLSLRHATA